MAIGLNGCPNDINGFYIVIIRAGVWWNVLREGFVMLLDVCEHSHPPWTRRARLVTGRLIVVLILILHWNSHFTYLDLRMVFNVAVYDNIRK
jgi:hypothetical protein